MGVASGIAPEIAPSFLGPREIPLEWRNGERQLACARGLEHVAWRVRFRAEAFWSRFAWHPNPHSRRRESNADLFSTAPFDRVASSDWKPSRTYVGCGS